MLRKLFPLINVATPTNAYQTSTRSMASKCVSTNRTKCVESSIFPLHVMGAGSIGLLYAAKMQEVLTLNSSKSQPPVTLLMRPHHEPFLIRDEDSNGHEQLIAPVTMLRSGEVTNYKIPVEIIGETDKDISAIHTLLLCTKANDACTALDSVWSRLQPKSSQTHRKPKLIILSNGALAIRDAILRDISADDVEIVFASTTHGAYKDNAVETKYCIRHAGEGLTHCTDGEFIRICRGIGWKSYEMTDFEMNLMLWKKLAVNCVINPLTAIYNVKNGELVGLQHSQDVKTIMTKLLEEVSSVALKEVELHQALKSSRSKETMQSVRKELSIKSLQTFVDKVIKDTADNISSMLQDAKSDRVTEVQYLNGHICRLGREKYNMECPYNASMCSAVEKLLTEKN